MRSGWIRSTDTPSLSDLILVTGSRSDGRKEVGGGAHRGGRLRRCAVQVVGGGDASVTSSVDGELDGDQCDAGKTRAWTASSFASSSEAERRLEGARASVTFGLHWRARFSAKRFSPRASRGAPEQRKKNRLGEEVRGHLSLTDFTGELVGTAESDDRFRRFGGASSRKKKGGRRSTSGGFYRSGLDGHYCENSPGGVTPAVSIDRE
jgi:hypothetical protein